MPTNKEWREAQISNPRYITTPLGKVVEINGKAMSEREFFGIKVLLPV